MVYYILKSNPRLGVTSKITNRENCIYHRNQTRDLRIHHATRTAPSPPSQWYNSHSCFEEGIKGHHTHTLALHKMSRYVLQFTRDIWKAPREGQIQWSIQGHEAIPWWFASSAFRRLRFSHLSISLGIWEWMCVQTNCYSRFVLCAQSARTLCFPFLAVQWYIHTGEKTYRHKSWAVDS